ncbi:MAG: LysR family transcriptional regulator [Xanthobacteraceae bacterium]|nr:LysR family transcriptional regulator [Xanthobacteraceae bacterium]
MDRFEAMLTFVRVAETGSLSAAARAIPTSLTSVSRQITALEERLGTQLLVRTTRHLSLTEDGRLFYERAKVILGELNEAELALSSGRSEPSGRLHVSSPVLIGRLLLAPLLPGFLTRHPSVAVDLLLVDRLVNLVEENIHAAVRIGPLPDSQLVARKLTDLRMVVCAAPDYLERWGLPQTPADLGDHDCLVFSGVPGSAEWRFQSGASRKDVRVSGRLWSNSLDALVSAAKDGAGIVRVPSWQVAADLETGRLKRILAEFERPPTPVNVLFQPAKLSSAKIRAFVDYLVEQWKTRKLADGRGIS